MSKTNKQNEKTETVAEEIDILDDILADTDINVPTEKNIELKKNAQLTNEQKAYIKKVQKAINIYGPKVTKLTAILNSARTKSIVDSVSVNDETKKYYKRGICTAMSESKRGMNNFTHITKNVNLTLTETVPVTDTA